MIASRLLPALTATVTLAASALAQTPAQSDSAARVATRTSSLSLITTRTLKFTTDEGTWISLDVAPGGQTIVFELLGDLYTLPISGGTATRITSGQGYDTQPRYSPDGTKIVFVSDRNGSENVWTANADGTQPKLRRFTPHDEIDKWKAVQWQREDQYVHHLHAQQLPKLLEAGGRLGLGSHGELQGLGAHWELWMMASGGMKAHDALRLATITGAESIGLSKDVGSLEVGKLADLLVLDRNPLLNIENTTSLRYVMKNGRLHDASTLDEVWPRVRPLPNQWWWTLEPPATERY